MVRHLVAYVAMGIAMRLAVAFWGTTADYQPPVSCSDRFWLCTGYVLGVLVWPLLVVGALAKILVTARHGPGGGS